MKFIIETYGCQMNVADSELIISILENYKSLQPEEMFEYTEDINQAQIIIFNTCSVRENAERRVLGRISNEISRKQRDRSILIGVVGCMAQRLGEKLNLKSNKRGIYPQIDFVAGVDQYEKLPEIIQECKKKHKFIAQTTFNYDENYTDLLPSRTNKLNAFVTIMRGCNNFCTYCIVPYTRGRERSRPVEEILKEIKQAGEEGYYDVTLLGQNVNSYRYEDINFPKLLQRANQIDSIKRLRFITSHPKDLSDELIEVMANSEKVCEHIHLPVQSGNNEILKRMNRNYTAEHYISTIQKLRNAMPNIAITTDVIAGFSGETEEQFMDTFNLMKEIRYDFAYMFKYSERSGTKATEFKDSVPEKERLARLQRLIDQQTIITTEKYKQKIGCVEEIYVESFSRKNANLLSGKTRDFKITVFEGDESLIHSFVKVKIIDAVGWTLKGKLIADD
ncbi:MAG: tRNA (N6-isopentenyl adenosine(37)-C2)-methylthiotransferase MiaB [Candidatus Cloacimonetes bacterium]|nr:tRNA (N6-isopentenyl adenosine(37)-C2)-methylthiotransferase MiaB [Candidatus Cloacimonadota bacterium]MDD4155728.1 tRNA (N6-isopentenyl adenosine(37)-C2)-methylthiotransferase MiaB [Candidatus Cloacimonadota bacterium]